MAELPEAFLERMRRELPSPEEYGAFLASYGEARARGIRLHLHRFRQLHESGHKIRCEELVREWGLVPVEGTQDARPPSCFYLDEERLRELGIRPGLHPYHAAGLYYMQDPSAMQAVPRLKIRPFDRVLDLCASPGGKASQCADLLEMAQGGFLVANEYVGKRARILSSNLERLGIPNAVVLQEDPERLAEAFPAFFTRILVDAPCSGEGLFRKDADAVSEWGVENVERCIMRQQRILRAAARMLMPGGRLVYATCTFEKGENEDMARYLLSLDPGFRLLEERRFWPHHARGEGQYIAAFSYDCADGGDSGIGARQESGARQGGFLEKTEQNGQRFLCPAGLPDFSGLRLLRKGVLYQEKSAKNFSKAAGGKTPRKGQGHPAGSKDGTAGRTAGKAEPMPAHALAQALDLSGDCPRLSDRAFGWPVLDLCLSDARVEGYLRGMEIRCSAEEIGTSEKGLVLVLVDGAALGFGRYAGGRVKNLYPKGLRLP